MVRVVPASAPPWPRATDRFKDADAARGGTPVVTVEVPSLLGRTVVPHHRRITTEERRHRE
jgi:hypothetical protein